MLHCCCFCCSFCCCCCCYLWCCCCCCCCSLLLLFVDRLKDIIYVLSAIRSGFFVPAPTEVVLGNSLWMLPCQAIKYGKLKTQSGRKQTRHWLLQIMQESPQLKTKRSWALIGHNLWLFLFSVFPQ